MDSFIEVVPSDKIAKVEQMIQDKWQSKRLEIRDAKRIKSRAIESSSCTQHISLKDLGIETLEMDL